jgi:hypothetical protein
MSNLPFKRSAFKLSGDSLKAVFENLVLDMHPELVGHKMLLEMEMNCEEESITIIVEPLCNDRQLFLDRPEPGKHLDS